MWVYYKQLQPGDWPRLGAAAKRFAKAHAPGREIAYASNDYQWFHGVDAWVAVAVPEPSRKRIQALWRGAIRRATGCKIADQIRDGWIVFWQKGGA